MAGKGRKWSTPGLLVQAIAGAPDQPLRLGFTASRKVGGAVERNRAKRRLRALAAEAAPAARAGVDLVLVARAATVRRPFALLRRDLEQALTRLDLWGRR
ncbi:MAG: hypothetical protein OHK0024_24630 [Thalassobaculales bacterium]